MWLQIPLASRGAGALNSPVRRRIVESVERHPGLTASALARKAGIGVVSLLYHLQILEHAGLVRTVRVGRRRLVFTKAAIMREDPAAWALLADATARRIAVAVARNPRCGVQDLVDQLGLTPRVVYHQLKKLRAVGLIDTPTSAGYRGLVPTSRLLAALPRLD